ncbi:3-phosphoshikimate 1-carboxyvinyltransferase [Flavobacterium sp. JP2137]|uniref:3-phosphoshikimate 1-carboxyvinyltransferase n=1 Tax=Flavobacterium sp. JP2137 TaxID=3414510 RepID=UPI003D2FB990
MKVVLPHSAIENHQSIAVSGSKSQTNRLLLLQQLYPNIAVENRAVADDSRMMQRALESSDSVIDIHHAGTAMRFLTAYFAIQPHRTVVLTGSDRMQQRPIGILVEALKQLGADIEYVDKPGFPPLRIRGKKLQQNQVRLAADVSSQYISALLLIAPQIQGGLELSFDGRITSRPYIEMTLALLNDLGIPNSFEADRVRVHHKPQIADTTLVVESDWSSASYFYALVALSPIGTTLTLSHYQEHSIQGDAAVVGYFRLFGVDTQFGDRQITLRKARETQPHFEADFIDTPDLAQTVVVTCFGLGISSTITGLHTLKIKETDRLAALETELQKLGAQVSTTPNSLTLQAGSSPISGQSIDTYQDHRMAMAFAPLALKTKLTINEAEVVSKSFVGFWETLQSLGIKATILPLNDCSLK